MYVYKYKTQNADVSRAASPYTHYNFCVPAHVIRITSEHNDANNNNVRCTDG